MANPVKKYPVPLIFKKIQKDKMSGELIIIHDNFTKRLYFIKGRLAFADTTVDKERLGDILLSIGKITKDQFDKLTRLVTGNEKNRKTGEVLTEITPLSMHDVYHALVLQIKIIAASAFKLKEGEWRFIVKPPEIRNPHKFHIRLPEIVAEGIKQIPDFSYYKRRFSMRAPVTTSIPEETRRYLTADQLKFYITLSNYTNEPLMRVLTELKTPENDIWRNIAAFYYMNILDFIEFTIDKEANQGIEEINDLHHRMKNQDLDFYQLLGVNNKSGSKEIKDAYFNFSRKYHPDRLLAPPDSTIKLRANEVLAEVNRAYETLSNEDKRREYDARGFKETPNKDEERINQSKKARNLYLKANTLYKLKKYFEASSLMEEAVQRDSSKASYYLLLGMCHAKLPATKNRAEQCLKKAAEMEPWNADHMFALGELYKSENLMKKAQIYFDKALEINMEHTLAGKAKEELDKLFGGGKKSIFSLFGKKK